VGNHAACINVDSFHYVPNAASTLNDRIPCSPNTTASSLQKQHSTIIIENGRAIVSAAQGATRADQCTCQPGAFALAVFESVHLHSLPLLLAHQGINMSDPVQVERNFRCRPCPSGAICDGNLIPPRARAGYGVLSGELSYLSTELERGHATFYECAGQQRCPGGDCDCLEGYVAFGDQSGYGPAGIDYHPEVCGYGYQDGSALCSLCNTTIGWVSSLEECVHCDWNEWFYCNAQRPNVGVPAVAPKDQRSSLSRWQSSSLSLLCLLGFPSCRSCRKRARASVPDRRSNSGPQLAVVLC
jgi:hypothetical protein